jgi:hypothetical protein
MYEVGGTALGTAMCTFDENDENDFRMGDGFDEGDFEGLNACDCPCSRF